MLLCLSLKSRLMLLAKVFHRKESSALPMTSAGYISVAGSVRTRTPQIMGPTIMAIRTNMLSIPKTYMVTLLLFKFDVSVSDFLDISINNLLST